MIRSIHGNMYINKSLILNLITSNLSYFVNKTTISNKTVKIIILHSK